MKMTCHLEIDFFGLLFSTPTNTSKMPVFLSSNSIKNIKFLINHYKLDYSVFLYFLNVLSIETL